MKNTTKKRCHQGDAREGTEKEKKLLEVFIQFELKILAIVLQT